MPSGEPSFLRRAYYSFVEACFVFFISPFVRIEVENRPDFKHIGPVVLAPNHASYLDPPILQHACRHHVTFLMTEAIYKIAPIRWFFKAWGARPVPEGRSATRALKDALGAIKRGRLVAIFPEGHISRDGFMNRGRGGVTTLIARGNVPVIPVAIIGTYDALPRHRALPRRARVVVRFGSPIPAPGRLSKEQVQDFADQIMDAIADLGAARRAPTSVPQHE
jgi:1-acyl-sn-glycerol-3-phosphate acyltransferase